MNPDMIADPSAASRLDRLIPMLQADPRNLRLLSDAAETALAEQRPEIAGELLERYAQIAPLPEKETNLAGLAAMHRNEFEAAAAHFERLVDAGVSDPAVRFNLAWARAMRQDLDGALELIDDEIARSLPQAAMLQIQILHEQGAFEDAAEKAREYVELHPEHRGLLAAVSVLALDVEDAVLAARCAAKAGDHPDALTTLGTLALGDDRATEALAIFDHALERKPDAPRAWVGRGLAKLLTGAADAAPDIDRGAQLFGDHLGSWIAAGWAHFVNHDLAASRARFETALEIDPTFAETHGSLAVLDILDGNIDSGRERSEIALRLDRNSYSAALARVLLAAGEGDQAAARRIFDLAVNMPVDEEGRTIAQALAKMGLSGS